MVCYFEHYVENLPNWFMYSLTFNSEADNNDERASSPTRRTVNIEAGLPIAHLQPVDREAGNPPSRRSQLFSAFASMAFELVLSLAETPASSYIPNRLRNKDLGSVNIHLVLLGYGSTFLVSTITQGEDFPGLDTIVLKRSIPQFKDQSESQVKKRIHSLMNELRVLAHDPIRKHENIVRLLGLAWETDPFDELRRWPVLLMEKATRGTLADFLQQGESYPPDVTLSLCLDVVLGLEILHTCGILHGDLKLENVLVLENSDPNTRAKRPYIAKLADFGGILFDLKHPTVLPSGTRPWNAPEWQDVLEPQSLLKTDLYSLGFLLWRIVTNGKHPFLDFGFTPDAAPTVAAWDKVESLKREDNLLAYMKSISNIPGNINMRTLHNILDWTVRLNSNFRSLDKVKSFVHDELDQQRAPPDFGGLARHQYQLRDQSLPFSFVGVDSLDPAIAKHVAAELIQTAQDTARPQEASEATYGLAVLIMNGHVADERSHKGREGGLLWLEEAAHLGNDRAKAMFFRACKAFGSDIPAKSINHIQSWLLDAGSKGYFTALEDLRELGLKDSISEATNLLGAIYGGTGAKRFDDDLFRPGFPCAGFSFDEDLSKRASTVTHVKNFRVNRFADCILHRGFMRLEQDGREIGCK